MTSIPKRRVVITGLGAVTNVGTDVPSMWRSVVEGRCGIGPITAFEQDEQWTARIAGEIHDRDRAQRIHVREPKRKARFCMFGAYAASAGAAACGSGP